MVMPPCDATNLLLFVPCFRCRYVAAYYSDTGIRHSLDGASDRTAAGVLLNVRPVEFAFYFGKPEADERDNRLQRSVERFFEAMADEASPQIAPCLVAVEGEARCR